LLAMALCLGTGSMQAQEGPQGTLQSCPNLPGSRQANAPGRHGQGTNRDRGRRKKSRKRASSADTQCSSIAVEETLKSWKYAPRQRRNHPRCWSSISIHSRWKQIEGKKRPCGSKNRVAVFFLVEGLWACSPRDIFAASAASRNLPKLRLRKEDWSR